MRKIAITGAVLLVAGVGAGFLLGRPGARAGPTPPHIITVTGGATVSSAPDEASIRLGVSTEADAAEAALQENSKRAAAVTRSVRADGVEEKDIQTTDVDLDKRYEDRGTPRERVFFRARNEITVTTSDLERVGEIVADAVAAGANDLGGVDFSLSDAGDAKRDAMGVAIESARAKAQALAAAAGANLGPVIRIDEERAESVAIHADLRNQALYASAKLPSPAPVSSGEVETHVSVVVVWALEA